MTGYRPAPRRRRGGGAGPPKARHGCDEDTGTVAPASPPPRRRRPWAAGRRSRRRARNSPVMTAPRVTSAGRNIPERRPGAAAGRRPPARTTSLVRARGRGCVSRGRDVALATAGRIFACRRYRPAIGTGRAGQIGGPRPVPVRRWHRIRAGMSIVEPRPPGRLWARGPPGRSCPGRQRAVPGTGSRPGPPGCRAGEGGACRAVNMAHTTFPASLGVV